MSSTPDDLQRRKDAFLQRFNERKQQQTTPVEGNVSPRHAAPPLPSAADKEKERTIVETELTATAAGPPAPQRAVAQVELNDAIQEQKDAHGAFLRAATYKKECEELIAELELVRAVLSDREKEAASLRAENTALDMKANEAVEKYAFLEKDLLRIREEQSSTTEAITSLRQEKASLEQEKDALQYRAGIFDQNLKIQEQNIKTLKSLAVSLSSEVESYKTKIDSLSREHKLAELKMQEEFTKEESALKNEFEAKLGQLRKLLDESEEIRQRSATEWRERELRLERKLHEELRSKDNEVVELRKKMEELMRQQITTMKDRLGTAEAVGGGASLQRLMRSGQSTRDLKKETDEVFRDLHYGQRVVSLAVTAAHEEGDPVTWTPKGPRHNFDPRARSYKVRLHANPDELTLAERGGTAISADLSMTAVDIAERHFVWKFVTKRGAVLNISLDIVPP